ncbi:unnamed protein product [Adineta ricciae]|uniref:UDP-sugar transporter protein SLC35A4 n=1 Tax=Adineta ricciae TaxID=249248 RepID=A0A814B1W0_ADIRI|nr:unnamed protein product [Adineta ricciae]
MSNSTKSNDISVDISTKQNDITKTNSQSAEKEMNTVSQSIVFRAMVLFQVMAYGSYSVLVHLCERNGSIMFSSTTMNLILEIIKLAFSISILLIESTKTSIDLFNYKSWLRPSLPYAIPGVLYFINNNLAVYIQLQMDPASYQILSNFKIVTTAILYRLIIKQKLTRKQWFAISLLFFSGLFYSLGAISDPTKNDVTQKRRMYIRPLGLPMVFAYCTFSGLAGVYNEWILKKHYSESLHVQNIYLYTYGTLLNLIPSVGIPLLKSQSLSQLNIFKGFSIYTWLIIITQALNGLFMSVVIKHTSNIIRLFVISFSLVVTAVLSVLVFGLTLNIYFFSSFAAMTCALYLYYSK